MSIRSSHCTIHFFGFVVILQINKNNLIEFMIIISFGQLFNSYLFEVPIWPYSLELIMGTALRIEARSIMSTPK